MKIKELLQILDLHTKLEIRTRDEIFLTDYPFTTTGKTKAKFKGFHPCEITYLYPKDEYTLTVYIESQITTKRKV